MSAAVALLPSLVAVMLALPADLPNTSPPPLTLATAGLPLDQITTRPVRVVPAESLVRAESCWVAPTRTVADAGLTITVATGTLITAMPALPLLPSVVAVTVAEPTESPVTTPAALTVATAGLLDAQVIDRPNSGTPFAPSSVAVSCAVRA